MSVSDIESKLSQAIGDNGVVRFCTKAAKDLTNFDANIKKIILAAIVRRGKNNPRIPPCESLHGMLKSFSKIKLHDLGIRIIYRIREVPEQKQTRMEVIAIGPRSDEEVYDIARARLTAFKMEMAKRLEDEIP